MHNLLAYDIHGQSGRDLPPTVLTIFGATGDLSSDYLMPALLHMENAGMLPEKFRVVAVGRRDLTQESYFDFVLGKSASLKQATAAARESFQKRLAYYRGDFQDPESFAGLAKVLADHAGGGQDCWNRLYYFATSPHYFSKVANILARHGLLAACGSHGREVRLLVEKPFGFNLDSSRSLNALLLKYFKESQIYRIDHYLGKETVQNLMVVRFANRLFEPLWNKDHIDHIQINVLYDDRVAGRSEYFDQAGSLKDIVQNHALQMLSLIAMDEPENLQTELVRQEKFKVLRALRPFNPKSAGTDSFKAQYQGYQTEIGKESRTETFAALKVFVDLPRWQDVPFYIRTGMAVSEKITEISVHFKELDRCLFFGCAANILAFRIQPDESVYLQINNKIPGFGVKLHQGMLDFSYGRAFAGAELPSAYERLLLDFIQGDQRLFIRSDEIEAAWQFVDSLAESWRELPLHGYEPGSPGPAEAEGFIGREARQWWSGRGKS